MKFAFISLDFLSPRPSSIGLATALLAGEIAELGHEVAVVAYSDQGRERTVDERGVAILPVVRGGEGRWGEIVLRWRIRNVLETERRARGLDGIEIPDFQGLLPFGMPGVRVQARLHNSATSLCQFRGVREGWLMRNFERSTLTRADRWIGASEFAFRRTEAVFGIGPEERIQIPCPVEIGEGASAGSAEGPFVFCGPLNWIKGGDLFVETARRARSRGIDRRFVVLGEDPEGWAQRSAGLVDCLGRVSHGRALEVIRRAAAVMCPSRIEFQGIAVAEAMARGVPVILPRREPFTEFFTDGQVCFVEGDEPDFWVDEIETLIRGSRAKTVGEAGRAVVCGQFSPRQVADRWLESWEERL